MQRCIAEHQEVSFCRSSEEVQETIWSEGQDVKCNLSLKHAKYCEKPDQLRRVVLTYESMLEAEGKLRRGLVIFWRKVKIKNAFDEPPYTERYVRWCERTAVSHCLLLDFISTKNDTNYTSIFDKHFAILIVLCHNEIRKQVMI